MSVVTDRHRLARWATQDGCANCQAKVAEMNRLGLQGDDRLRALVGMHEKCGDPAHLLPFEEEESGGGDAFASFAEHLFRMYEESAARHPKLVGSTRWDRKKEQ